MFQFTVTFQWPIQFSRGPIPRDRGWAVELYAAPERYIAAIKAVRTELGYGLKEAKDAVRNDSYPHIVAEELLEHEARSLNQALAAVGANSRVKRSRNIHAF